MLPSTRLWHVTHSESLSDQRCPNGSETRNMVRSRITLLSTDLRLVFVWIFAWDKEFATNFNEIREYYLLAMKTWARIKWLSLLLEYKSFLYLPWHHKLKQTVNVNLGSPGPKNTCHSCHFLHTEIQSTQVQSEQNHFRSSNGLIYQVLQMGLHQIKHFFYYLSGVMYHVQCTTQWYFLTWQNILSSTSVIWPWVTWRQ